MSRLSWFVVVLMVGFVGGCGDSTEETPDAPEPVEEAEASAEPEEAGLSIPDSMKDLIVVPESLILTVVNVVDEGEKQYHIEADTRDNVDKVQNKFIKIYGDMGWEEDVNMSQKGQTTTGFNHEGFMVFIQADKGNLGSIVKIDTGML